MAAVLTGCSVPDSGTIVHPDPVIHTLNVFVRAAADAPDNYGVRPGAMIAGAEVYLVDKAAPDVAVQDGRTNDSGRVEFMVQPGSYRIHASRATSDQFCHWFGSTDVDIRNGTRKTYLDTWVACE